ncbi:hypothetical protein FBUS_07524, partial [Fasciolopsis buskii]
VLLHSLTNGLRWLFYLVHRNFSGARSAPTNLSNTGLLDPLSHFTRLCIGCLAYPGAGALGFGESGYLLAQMISRLEPVSRLSERAMCVQSFERVDLPQQCASFYDLYVLLLPLDDLLYPEETDESVLRSYVAAVWSGVVRVDKQPLLFLIAIHHLNR